MAFQSQDFLFDLGDLGFSSLALLSVRGATPFLLLALAIFLLVEWVKIIALLKGCAYSEIGETKGPAWRQRFAPRQILSRIQRMSTRNLVLQCLTYAVWFVVSGLALLSGPSRLADGSAWLAEAGGGSFEQGALYFYAAVVFILFVVLVIFSPLVVVLSLKALHGRFHGGQLEGTKMQSSPASYSPMQTDYTQHFPEKYRPTGDGHFLYRFRARDYVLTRGLLLRQGKLARNSLNLICGLGIIAFLTLFLVFDLGSPWRSVTMAGFVVLSLISLMGFHLRARALLEGCDYREVPKVKGMVARGAQWLEYNRSIYLSNNPPPIQLLVYCLVTAGMFVYFMSALWPPLSKLDGLEFVIKAVFYVPVSAVFFGFSAVSFYALFRAIARNRGKASGSDKPPSN